MGTGTDIDLVQRHAEFRREVLLDKRARLVLHLEVLLENIVLLFGEARLHVAGRRLLRRWVSLRGPARLLRRVGRIHTQHAATTAAVSHDFGRLQ
jgi:hypothetical protein